MKTLKIVSLVFFTMLLAMNMDAQTAKNNKKKTMDNYEQLWKQIEEYQKKDQPRSAEKVVLEIYDKAEKEKNFGQLMKAGMMLMTAQCNISPDSAFIAIDKLEAMPTGNVAEEALKNALMASVYSGIPYSITRYNEDYRKRFDTGKDEYARKSIENMEALAGVNAQAYESLYKKGVDSRLYQHDVLSLVVLFLDSRNYFSVEENVAMYERAARIYKDKGMVDAANLMQMKAWKYQTELQSKSKRLGENDYVQKLKTMYEQNLNMETGADAFVEYMRNVNNTKKPLTYTQQLKLARWALKQWPDSKLSNTIKNMEINALRPEVSITQDNNLYDELYANQEFSVFIRHRNVKTVTVKVDGKVWNTLNFPYVEGTAEELQTEELKMKQGAGLHWVTLESGGVRDKTQLHLSSIKTMCFIMPWGERMAVVVDALSGRPVEGCKVVGTWNERVGREWKSMKEEYLTNKNGEAIVGNKVREVIAIRCEGDTCQNYLFGNIDNYRGNRKNIIYQCFTDRAIYRPGQTVHVSGLVYRQDGDVTQALKNEQVEVVLRDANWQEVGKTMVRTDDFGCASTDFVLPKDRLNGHFSISFGEASHSFRVEEYKRPTFTVEIEKPEGRFSVGDSIELIGTVKTYSGVPVQDAKVEWEVESGIRSFWYWRWDNNLDYVDDGEMLTDENGQFRVKVYLDGDRLVNDDDEEEDEEQKLWRTPEVLMYNLNAKVTDLAGETHEGEISVRVSKQEFSLQVEMEKTASGAKVAKGKVKAKNAQGVDVPAQGEWVLQDMDGKEVRRGTFEAGKDIEIDRLKELSFGSYDLKLNAKDSKNNTIRYKAELIWWDEKGIGRKMRLKNDFFTSEKDEFSPNEGIDIWYALAEEDALTYLYVVSNEKMILKRMEVKGTELQKLHLDYKPEYGDGVTVLMAYVKNGKKHKMEKHIRLALPEKDLALSWTTFRDKLTPGQQETWTMRVVDKQGKPVPAQLMATMYDASLDVYEKLSWPFSLQFYRRLPLLSSNFASGGHLGGMSLDFKTSLKKEMSRVFSRLNPYQYTFSDFRNSRMVLSGAPLREISVGAQSADFGDVVKYEKASDENLAIGGPLVTGAAVEEEVVDENPLLPASGMNGAGESSHSAPLRENFNETAFFYPNLQTNAKGEVEISFTLPESLTEWTFMGLAHTKDMDYGSMTSNIVARKELMVQPNMPRFVRHGDKMSIASRIINQSEKAVEGNAIIRLLDPETEKEVWSSTQKFNVEAGKTTSVSFDYDIPEDYSMLICEISAGNKTFSDGERNWLPILTSKKYLTETVPFYIEGKGEKQVDLSTLFNNNSPTATQRKMVFEYTDNPSWNAVMALHAVANPEDDDAIDWSVALYANRVAQSLAKRMPKLQNLIKLWSAEEGKETTLQSELEKNQQLKDILLLETPWVLDAQDETEQRHKLCELFNENLLNHRIQQAKEKLEKLQYSNGGWAWFDGMEPNYYVTLSVSEHLAMLKHYLASQNEADANVNQMVEQGLQFVDSKEVEYYNKYYKKDKKSLPSESSFRWMYASYLAEHKMNAEAQSVKEIYLNRVENKVGALTMYGRANVAVVLQQAGRKDKAKEFIQSLAEYTVTKPGMGRYFDTEKAHYSWMDYRIPTHVAAMRAFMETEKEKAFLPDMQLWLLRQKQTQKWDNVINTIQVVDLLLTISPEQTFHEPELPKVVFSATPNTSLSLTSEQNSPTAGVGYSKVPVPAEMLKSSSVSVTKMSEGISWGCVYGQFLENLDAVQQQSSGELSISRKAYVEVSNGSGKEWRELKAGDALSIGDKVKIRMTVNADRDMDFVQIRAQHAACLEPLKLRSGYQSLGGRGGYLSLHDASADVFFDWYRKGSATIDLDFYVTRSGNYSLGVATIQCAYASEFAGHSKGERIVVK